MAWLAIETFVRAGLMIVPLADRLEAIVTFAFDESRGTLGAFELNEAEISEELELVSTLKSEPNWLKMMKLNWRLGLCLPAKLVSLPL